MSNKLLLASASAVGLFGASAAVAQPEYDPYAYSGGTPITLTGTVTESGVGAIGLNYGQGSILVELDDYDAFNEASLVEAGDVVTVSGVMDDDFFEALSIEADAIFIHDSGVLYDDLSAADDEDPFDFAARTLTYAHPLLYEDGAFLSLAGRVASIDEAEQEFMLDTGFWRIQVDTEELGYDPYDSVWIGNLDTGDEVRVTGVFDVGVLERSELIAQSLVTLYEQRTMHDEDPSEASE